MSYPKRGFIYWVNLDPTIGSEIQKKRPAVIVSNDIHNQYSSRVIVAPITSSLHKLFPFEVPLELQSRRGKVLVDQVRSVDKQRLGKHIGSCDQMTIGQIDQALKLVFQLI